MDLKNLLSKKPSEMTDAELTDRINRLRTAKVDGKGKIVARTQRSRKYVKVRKLLVESKNYTDEQIDKVIAQMEENDAADQANLEQSKIPSLEPGKTYLPEDLFDQA